MSERGMGDDEAAGVSRAHSPTTCLKYSGIHARRMKYPQLLTKLAKIARPRGRLGQQESKRNLARSFPFAIAASPGELSTTAPPPSISASSLGSRARTSPGRRWRRTPTPRPRAPRRAEDEKGAGHAPPATWRARRVIQPWSRSENHPCTPPPRAIAPPREPIVPRGYS